MLRRRERKLNVTVRFDSELREKVEALAKERGVTISEAVRYILEKYVPVVASESSAVAKAI